MRILTKVVSIVTTLAIALGISAVPTCASVKDTTFKSTFLAYTQYYNTISREKEDSTSVYMKNTSGMTLWVYTNGGTKPSGTPTLTDTGTTIGGHANVKVGEYKIRNYVYEKGYKKVYLNLSTATSGVSGYLNGKWSPDSVGTYPSAN